MITQAYCENPDCNVRQIEITTKDYDRPDPDVWHCPACGSVCSVHVRRTLAEHERAELKTAIGRVNIALYQRDHAGGTGPVPVPLSLWRVEELPDGWKPVPAPEK